MRQTAYGSAGVQTIPVTVSFEVNNTMIVPTESADNYAFAFWVK